jgi:hypothetical protein
MKENRLPLHDYSATIMVASYPYGLYLLWQQEDNGLFPNHIKFPCHNQPKQSKLHKYLLGTWYCQNCQLFEHFTKLL